MTSTKKTLANQANARRSTGPRSPLGKRRASRNALRHGLSLPVLSDPGLTPAVEALAQKILTGRTDPGLAALAHDIAAAQVDLDSIARMRGIVMSGDLVGQHEEFPFILGRSAARASAAGATRRGVRPVVPEQLARDATAAAAESLTFALDRTAHELAILARYERRAFSRRKSAIRAFDVRRLELEALLAERSQKAL